MPRYSVSEIQGYLRCRRQWDLTSQNRKGLTRTGIAPKPLQIGSALHAAFDAQATGKNPMVAVEEYFDEELDRIETEYLTLVGVKPSHDELAPFREASDEAYLLAYRYFSYYGWDQPLGRNYEYVQTEVTFEIPIPGTRNKLIGTFDGIARHTPTDTYWLVEHKTYSQQPNFDKMTTDWQLSCYLWAAEILFGQQLEGVLYDGLAKKLPKVPHLLSTGELSRAKNVLSGTDELSYLEAIRENGLDPANYESELQFLRQRDMGDQTPFFTRWRITFPQQVLIETERILQDVTREMSSRETPIIPNFRWEGCWDCGVRDLCKSIQFGEDTDYLIKSGYKKGEGHATVKRMSRPRETITSVLDLVRR